MPALNNTKVAALIDGRPYVSIECGGFGQGCENIHNGQPSADFLEASRLLWPIVPGVVRIGLVPVPLA